MFGNAKVLLMASIAEADQANWKSLSSRLSEAREERIDKAELIERLGQLAEAPQAPGANGPKRSDADWLVFRRSRTIIPRRPIARASTTRGEESGGSPSGCPAADYQSPHRGHSPIWVATERLVWPWAGHSCELLAGLVRPLRVTLQRRTGSGSPPAGRDFTWSGYCACSVVFNIVPLLQPACALLCISSHRAAQARNAFASRHSLYYVVSCFAFYSA